MPINSSSIPALRVARAVKKRKRYASGGTPSNPALWDAAPDEVPNDVGMGSVASGLGHIAKGIFWDMPRNAIEAAKNAPPPGLRREDFTDIPESAPADPNALTSKVGLEVPTRRAGPYDPLIGSAGEAALNTAGITMPFAKPGTLGIFGGRMAKTADHEALARAEKMAAEGADRKQIWDETGWFKDVDGNWKFEIPDFDSRFNRVHSRGTIDNFPADVEKTHVLGEAYSHPALYEAYPDIATRPLEVRAAQGYKGAYFPDEDKLVLAQRDSRYGDELKKDIRSVTLHEAQHMVQQREGFARGANTELPEVHQAARAEWTSAKEAAEQKFELLTERRQKWLDDYASQNKLNIRGSREDYGQAAKAYKDTFPELEAARNDAFVLMSLPGMPRSYRENAYKSFAGEVEARNVQARADLDPKTRREIPPWETADVPADRQIVSFRNSPGGSMAEIDRVLEAERAATKPVAIEDLHPEVRSDIANTLMDRVPALGAYAKGRPEDIEGLISGAHPTISVPRRMVDPSTIDLSNRTVSPAAVEKYSRLTTEPPPIVMAGDQLIEGGHRVAAAQKAGRHLPAVDVSDLLKGDWPAWLEGGELTPKGAQNARPVSAEPAAAAVPGELGPGGGGQAGTRSLAEAQAAAARWAGNRQPLPGIQGPLKIGDDYFVPGPIGRVHDVAEQYMKSRPDINYAPPDRFHPIDPEHSKAIAKAYEEMKHAPNDPAVKNAYEAMINETKAQYDAIKASGLKIEPIPPGMPDPYAQNPRLAAWDVAENNHLWFFPTTEGFGTVNKISDNPLLRKMGEKIGDHEMTANDMFRVVHDYFGHLKHGHGFRAAGEDNAWRTHAAMYSDLARPAMTTETRGQNSWVNFGPHGEKNRTASGVDTVYADQKVGLLPDWVMYDRGKAPIEMYHGSVAQYDRPDLSKIGTGQGEMAYGAGYYGSKGERVAKRYRDMQTKDVITRNGQPVSLDTVQDEIQTLLRANGASPGRAEHLAEAVIQMRQMGWSPRRIAEAAKAEGMGPDFDFALRAAKKFEFGREPGHMYKWAIETPPDRLLDWDAPFKRQSQYVQGQLGEHMERDVARQKVALEKKIAGLKNPTGWVASRYKRPGGDIMRERDIFDAENRLHNLNVPDLSGKSVYTRMGLPAATKEEGYIKSSQRLAKEHGIPGLQYRNASGGADSGVRNYVLFDPKFLRLLRRYGIAGLPFAGAALDGEEPGRFRGGRIHKAGGGAFGVFSPAEQAELDAVAPMRVAPEPDDSPVRFRTAHPLTDITERDIDRGIDIGLNAATVGGPTRRIADDAGAAMTAARRAKRYAEPEYAPSGRLIINKGVENPPDRAIQTVADPYRMMFPGIYRDPRILAAEAAERVGPEDPAMKQLFGVTRGELREMAQGRKGNEDPRLHLVKNPRGSLAAQNIQTPQNTQRLIDILHEGGRHEGLRTADAWYIMDPVYNRMKELHGPEAAERYRRFNTLTGMASPGSPVVDEIKRGTAANWLQQQGRFEDFRKYAGIPEELRGRVRFPDDMRRIPGHPYHRTSQSDPMAKYLEAGEIQSKNPKVPLYVHASGVPETGFQTSGPVGDAHFSRGVGLADTRKGPTDVGASFSTSEYQTLQPWWQHEVAGAAGLESVPAQARLWTVLGPQTGVESALGAPKLELLSQQIMEAARRLRISPERARDLILSGEAGAFKQGGAVDSAMSVARAIKRAKGGKVHVGPISGDTGGRADKVPMRVPNGAYVLTADHVSGLGEGNTEAGMKKLSAMFPKSKPSRLRQLPSKEAIPIYAADGEFVVSPEDIVDRFGKLDYGHKALDEWQTLERQHLIETLKNLAPPAQD